MKIKSVIVLIILLNVATNVFADEVNYGLNNASISIRESQNDFNGYMQRQAIGMASMFQINRANQYYSQPQQAQPQQYVNPNRSYVIDKPLPLNGIYSYDAYGSIK